MKKPINIPAAFERFEGAWSPKIVAEYNDNEIFLAKFKGEFVWHVHEDTDDVFLVIKGDVTIKLRDEDVHLSQGDLFVVPKGVEHCPMASEEAHVLLIEPKGTPNTGDEATAAKKERLDDL